RKYGASAKPQNSPRTCGSTRRAASSAALDASEDPTWPEPEEDDRDQQHRGISPCGAHDRRHRALDSADEAGPAHQPHGAAEAPDHENEERLEDVVESHVRLY